MALSGRLSLVRSDLEALLGYCQPKLLGYVMSHRLLLNIGQECYTAAPHSSSLPC